jgi:hypothetical protein
MSDFDDLTDLSDWADLSDLFLRERKKEYE